MFATILLGGLALISGWFKCWEINRPTKFGWIALILTIFLTSYTAYDAEKNTKIINELKEESAESIVQLTRLRSNYRNSEKIASYQVGTDKIIKELQKIETQLMAHTYLNKNGDNLYVDQLIENAFYSLTLLPSFTTQKKCESLTDKLNYLRVSHSTLDSVMIYHFFKVIVKEAESIVADGMRQVLGSSPFDCVKEITKFPNERYTGLASTLETDLPDGFQGNFIDQSFVEGNKLVSHKLKALGYGSGVLLRKSKSGNPLFSTDFDLYEFTTSKPSIPKYARYSIGSLGAIQFSNDFLNPLEKITHYTIDDMKQVTIDNSLPQGKYRIKELIKDKVVITPGQEFQIEFGIIKSNLFGEILVDKFIGLGANTWRSSSDIKPIPPFVEITLTDCDQIFGKVVKINNETRKEETYFFDGYKL